jgi:drug/metabolite transporter (DMT)-like permease
MVEQNTRLGILLMVATVFLFAIQDGINRYLAEDYSIIMLVMLRYWAFAAFVMFIAARKLGGLARAMRTPHPVLQFARGALLAVQTCVMILGFTLIGLAASLAVFTSYPLIVAALSGPILGEKVGWRRWLAIVIGLAGVTIILQPGSDAMRPEALVSLGAAVMFALYGLLTRHVSRTDPSWVSFFWTGMGGAVVMTVVGVWFLEPMSAEGWFLVACLCVFGTLAHWLLIRCYEVAEASAVQPFAYLHLVFGSTIGVVVFNETIAANMIVGAAFVVGAGIFTLVATRNGGR